MELELFKKNLELNWNYYLELSGWNYWRIRYVDEDVVEDIFRERDLIFDECK